jgi:hypothetical protein
MWAPPPRHSFFPKSRQGTTEPGRSPRCQSERFTRDLFPRLCLLKPPPLLACLT